jgi:hypothetical protein
MTRMTIELRGAKRADGCYHLKSPELPGFHFIVGPEERQTDFEGPLYAALKTFMPALFQAQARKSQEQAKRALTITSSRSQINFTAELEFA